MDPEPALPVTDWRGAEDVLTYDTWTQIRSLQRQGQSIRQIARGLDVARKGPSVAWNYDPTAALQGIPLQTSGIGDIYLRSWKDQ